MFLQIQANASTSAALNQSIEIIENNLLLTKSENSGLIRKIINIMSMSHGTGDLLVKS